MKATDTRYTSIIEVYLTPFDDLIYNAQAQSVVSTLEAGKVIGLDLIVTYFDESLGTYASYMMLSDRFTTWKYSERFVDGLLVGANSATSIKKDSWGRIKKQSKANR